MPILIKKITLSRFNALATYARNPAVKSHSQEQEWFETFDGKVLGLLLLDTIDNDYAGLIFSRDGNKRYRFISMTSFGNSDTKVRKELLNKIRELHPNAEEHGIQGDENKKNMDFFVTLDKKNIHPDYFLLKDSLLYSGAKNIIEPLMRWYIDIDGNFVEQFQTTGFNQRIWELLIFCIFTENDCIFNTSYNTPDFNARFIKGFLSTEFSIEATTINPPIDAKGNPIALPKVDRSNIEEYKNLLVNYFPTRYSGPLLAKLKKKYWEQEHVSGKPFAIAIADCQFKGAGNLSYEALPLYLYGFQQIPQRSGRSKRINIDFHIWGTKQVPSGFFNFPESENISAIIFSPSSDIDKFNRMGLQNGFNSTKYKIKRIYKSLNCNSSQIEEAKRIIPSKNYTERWDEGLIIYHNPNALHPFPDFILPNATHYKVINGEICLEFTTPPIIEDYSEIINKR